MNIYGSAALTALYKRLNSAQNFYKLLDGITESALQMAGKSYVENMRRGLKWGEGTYCR